MVRSGRGRPPAHLKQLQRKSSNSIGSGGRSGGAEQRRQTHRASLYGAEGEDAGASSGDLVGDEAGEVTTAPPWMRGEAVASTREGRWRRCGDLGFTAGEMEAEDG
jgi:hypothetical protein